MRQELAEQWANILESGEFKQGKGYLRRDDEYCCLGVLCAMAVREGVIPAPKLLPTGDGTTQAYYYDSASGTLPFSVELWADMQTGVGEIDFGRKCLSDMNDNGKTFAELANIIRENWEIL